MLPLCRTLSVMAVPILVACQPTTPSSTSMPRHYQTHGMVFYDAGRHLEQRDDTQPRKGFGHVAIPDIRIELRKPGTTDVVESGHTDLEGHFRLDEAKEGQYDLCWQGDGWLSQCLPKPIQINGHAFYAEPIFLQPDNKVGGFPLVGDVKFKDQRLCRLTDTTRGIDLTATVVLEDGGVPLKKVRANAFGQFVVPSVPASAAAPGVSARCADLSADEAKTKVDAWLAEAGTLGLVTGDFATFTAADATAPVMGASGFSPRHLLLGGQPPRLANFAIRDAANRIVSRASMGDQVSVSAQALAGAKPVRFWRVSGGALAAAGDAVQWTLPTSQGQFQIELLMADGRGGWLRQMRTVQVTKDLRLAFSGRVRTSDGGGLAAANVKVDVNGKALALDANGFFYGRIDPVAGARYVLNVTGDGYLPVSSVYHRESSGATYLLERVQTIPFNAGSDQTLNFPPPLKREQPTDRRPATVKLKAGSLRNGAGPYFGPATASGAYLDPSQRALPGDYDATSLGGADQSLISFGALYVTFKDDLGQPLQLVDGASADIRIPLPVDRNPATAGATIPIWYYDPLDGYWKEEDNKGKLDGDAYIAQVKHFSTINMDVGTVGDAVCVRVEVDFLKTPADRILRATLTLPGGGTQVKQNTLDVQLNAVYRLLPNQTLTFDIRRADGSDYPEFVLRDRRNGDAVIASKSLNLVNADKMDGIDLWPESPFDDCKPFVLVTGDIDAPAEFYTRKDADATDPEASGRAQAYYQLMDPNGDRENFQEWLTLNGFQPSPTGDGGFSFPPAAQVVSVAYLNHGDLGSGRKMHCRKDADRVACFVDNYATDGDIANAFNLDPAGAVVAQEANSGTGFATVAMEFAAVEGINNLGNYGFGDAKVVKFFTFGGGGARVTEAALDRVSGNRWQPNVCMVCHGGNVPGSFVVKDAGGNEIPGGGDFPTSAAAVNALSAAQKAGLVAAFKGDMSSFREFDLGNLRNLQGTNPENKMKQLNCNYVRHTQPNAEITDVIATWYASPACTEAGSPTQNEYLPASFVGANAGIYRDVTARVCRTCHIAQQGLEMIEHDGYPWSSMTGAQPYTCSQVMPQAFIPYHAYWMEGMHGKVLAKYGSAGCP